MSVDFTELDESTLTAWGAKRDEIIRYLKSNLSSHLVDGLLRLISEYEELGRKRSRIISAYKLLTEKA